MQGLVCVDDARFLSPHILRTNISQGEGYKVSQEGFSPALVQPRIRRMRVVN